jgi:hypothetical protein
MHKCPYCADDRWYENPESRGYFIMCLGCFAEFDSFNDLRPKMFVRPSGTGWV